MPAYPLLSFRRSDTNEMHLKAVNRVIEAIRSNPTSTLSVNAMSRIAYMSPYHFIRVFQGVTGIAPCKFQWALKVHTAKHLLLATTMSIVDVSMEVGYNSLGTFTRRFSELVGIPPNRFRHMARTVEAAVFERTAREHEGLSPWPQTIEGTVHAPPAFSGTILVVCFASFLSKGPLLQYAVADSRNRFAMEQPTKSPFYLRAFGVPDGAKNTTWFTDDNLLRSNSGHLVTTHLAGDWHEVALRSYLPTDPPILIALGTLINGPAESRALSPRPNASCRDAGVTSCNEALAFSSQF